MARAPNGHLLVANNDVINSDPKQPSEIVEFTIGGQFVKQPSVDPNQGGSFGLQVALPGNNTTKSPLQPLPHGRGSDAVRAAALTG